MILKASHMYGECLRKCIMWPLRIRLGSSEVCKLAKSIQQMIDGAQSAAYPRTSAIPLGDKFMLRQDVQITSEDLVHIKPDPTVIPKGQQSYRVPIHPCRSVIHLLQNFSLVQHRPCCHLRHIYLFHAEYLWPFSHISLDKRICRKVPHVIRP